MLLVAPVRASRCMDRRRRMRGRPGWNVVNVARSDIPAVTHVDYSARVQTVDADTHPLYHRLIHRFKDLTGYGSS